jgi:hypothetical protein
VVALNELLFLIDFQVGMNFEKNAPVDTFLHIGATASVPVLNGRLK